MKIFVSDLDSNDDIRQLLKQYRLLNYRDRELVKNIINSLAEKIEGQQWLHTLVVSREINIISQYHRKTDLQKAVNILLDISDKE